MSESGDLPQNRKSLSVGKQDVHIKFDFLYLYFERTAVCVRLFFVERISLEVKMKKKFNKVLSGILAVTMLFCLIVTQVSAQSVDSEINGLVSWLANSEKTEFDFTDTSALDTDVLWTVLVLSKAGNTTAYPEFENYIDTIAQEKYSTLTPANFALIYLAADANGLDTENIGGHDMLTALKGVDYTAQTYLSSLYYPLIALDYKEAPEYSGVRKDIIDTILAAQQDDGGFPWCSVDTGYGISSDPDTTSFVLQALSDFKSVPEVASAIDEAYAYLQTQKFDDGSYGYTAWSSPSAESTAQAIIANNCLGKDCDDSVTALKTYINAETGGAKDYTGSDNTMTSYQTLLALLDVKSHAEGGKGIYKYVAPEVTESTTEAETTSTTTASAQTTTAVSVTKATDSKKVNIPRTGGNAAMTVFVGLALVTGAASLVVRKKDED